jgi:hypothetical protein
MSQVQSEIPYSIYSFFPLTPPVLTPSETIRQPSPALNIKRTSSENSYLNDFEQTSLTSPAPEKLIRLLRLYPGSATDPVHCSLEVVDLNDHPRFEALSYVWGNPNPPENIFCCGQKKFITPNLAAALRRLRESDRERVVWIDAICINQDDLKERSQQVLLMKDIYSQAWRVVVWLCEDHNGYAALAIEMVNKMVGYACSELGTTVQDLEYEKFLDIKNENMFSEMKAQRDFPTLPFDDNKPDIERPREWEAILWLYSQPWFSRVWVIQEVAFSAVVVYIGGLEMAWKAVALAAQWIWKKGYISNDREIYLYSNASTIVEGATTRSLWNHVHSFKDFKATDPRDKIYALLGISRSNSHNIEPDYTSSTSGVYASIVRSGMLLQLKTFVVFSMVQVHDEEPDEEFPSWVPRLDRELRIEGILSHYMDDFGWNASKGSSIDVLDVEDENCLVLRGLRISQIDFTSDVLHRRPWEQEDFDAVWQITKRRLGPYYNNTSELAQAFVHTITI